MIFFFGCARSSRLSLVAVIRGLSLAAACGPLIAVAAPIADHGKGRGGFSSCGTRAQLPQGMWNPSGPGIEPMSPARGHEDS